MQMQMQMQGTSAHAQGSPVVWRALARQKERRRRQKERTELLLHSAKFSRNGSGALPSGAGYLDRSQGAAAAAAAGRKRGATTAKLPNDLLGLLFAWLGQERLAVCYRVCRQWRGVIERDSHLNIVLKVQVLHNQCYDEVYNCDSLDLYGHEVDFCFTDPPSASILTVDGWKETHHDDPRGALKKASHTSLRLPRRRGAGGGGGGKPRMVAVPAGGAHHHPSRSASTASAGSSSSSATALPTIATGARPCVTAQPPPLAAAASSSSSSSAPMASSSSSSHYPAPPAAPSIEVRGSKLGGSQRGGGPA